MEGMKLWPCICSAAQAAEEEASITSITPSEEQRGLDASRSKGGTSVLTSITSAFNTVPGTVLLQ